MEQNPHVLVVDDDPDILTALRLLLRKSGFEVLCNDPFETKSNVTRRNLARSLREMSDDDLSTSTAFVVAVPAA